MSINRLTTFIIVFLVFYLTVAASSGGDGKAISASNSAATLSGRITDRTTGEELPCVTIYINPGKKGLSSDANGRYSVSLPPGGYDLTVTYVGYKTETRTVDLTGNKVYDIELQPNTYALGEVVVSAREGEKLSSGSRIDRSAMEHLQPSSFTDLLELLPGNISKDPALTGANTITLRETGNICGSGSVVSNDDYAISSLGTLFVVDGAPLSTAANLQTVGNTSDYSSPDYKRNITNKGVDMRTISTDNIESVEIVRGIPGAEYGNLSSGMVNIKRISRATPFTARFKADGYSKLFFLGKGIRFGSDNNILNLDFGYLDSKGDPRDIRESYRRLTGSARFYSKKMTGLGALSWSLSGDFTGSFDNSKIDPDLSLRKIDEYKSVYRRFSLTGKADWSLGLVWLDRIQLNLSSSLQDDILEQRKQVAPTHPSVAPTSMELGVQEGSFILSEYVADYRSEGRPFNLFGKLTLSGSAGSRNIDNEYKAGIEYSVDKNFGEGQIYDLTRPLSASWTSRPRRFRDIPALNSLSAFIQDQFSIDLSRAGHLDLLAGLRLQTLVGIDSRYRLAGKVYLDPRFNLLWHIGEASRVQPFVGGGFGMTSRMPTIDYLYPQDHYTDLIQLNYYDVNNPEEYSRINLRTYIDNTINYDLQAARNRKWEIRAGFANGCNSLSVIFFGERMNSGFRYSTVYSPYSYTTYDATSIPVGTLQGPPVLESLPTTARTVLSGYRRPSNGTRIDKRGIEFQFSSARWKALATALTVSGAWFESVYSNSDKIYSPVSDVVGDIVISDRYVGLYDHTDGRRNSQFNTNIMFDTQITRWGLVFTTTLQCMWYVKTRQIPKDGTPVAYLSAEDGKIHQFTSESAADPILSKLIKRYNANLFDEVNVPTALYVNLKATKSIGKWLTVSIFVNRLFDWLPDYKVNGLTVRRNADSYFGMELNLKL